MLLTFGKEVPLNIKWNNFTYAMLITIYPRRVHFTAIVYSLIFFYIDILVCGLC